MRVGDTVRFLFPIFRNDSVEQARTNQKPIRRKTLEGVLLKIDWDGWCEVECWTERLVPKMKWDVIHGKRVGKTVKEKKKSKEIFNVKKEWIQ